MPPSEDALKQERLVVEIASGIKMLEFGLPARLTEDSMKIVEYWNRELKENPILIDALESDVNNALEVIHKAEKGEKQNMLPCVTGRRQQIFANSFQSTILWQMR